MFSPHNTAHGSKSKKTTLIIITTNVRFAIISPHDTFPSTSLMWAEKNDFYPCFLNKEARAKGNGGVTQDLWRDHLEETALTFIIAHIHIFKERIGGRRMLVSRLKSYGLFLHLPLPPKEENHWFSFLKAMKQQWSFK